MNKKKKKEKKKENLSPSGLYCSRDHKVKIKESEQINKYLDIGTKKDYIKHEGDCDTNTSWNTWNGPKRNLKVIGTIGNQRKNRDYSGYNIVEIGLKTEKNSGDSKRLQWKFTI